MERNHIDRLSPELVTQILLELPTSRSLHSLIRASSKCYYVFLDSKAKILVSLVRRTIRPAAFIDALAAVQASQLKELRPDRKAVLNFLRKYESNRQKAVEQEYQKFSVATAVSLWRLHGSTQYIIKDLISRSNFYLCQCKDSLSRLKNGSDGRWRSHGENSTDRDYRYAPLSYTEEVRLQRAFYRYQLYTQIFSSDMEYGGEKLWTLPSDSHFFLDKYSLWEVDELACVENHLWTLLSNTFDRIEPTFVGIRLPVPPLDDPDISSTRSINQSMALREAKYQIHSLYKDYLLNLSLPFVQYALQLDRLSMQREASSRIYYDGQKRSLSTTLEGYRRGFLGKESSLIYNYNLAISRGGPFLFTDALDGPNEGWLCVWGKYHSLSSDRIRNITQSLGYVFWDSARLRGSGFCTSQYVQGVSSVFQS